MEKNIMRIHDEYVTLGQLVKHFRLIDTGGEEKQFVKTHKIIVNGEKEDRRGRKLRPGDIIDIDDIRYQVCSSEN